MKKWKKVGGTLIAMASILAPLQYTVAFAQDRMDITYINTSNPDKYLEYINYIDSYTHDSLDVVSPSYFGFNADGTLKINDSFKPEFITEMHNRGVQVVPFLQKSWSQPLALNNVDVLASAVANAIQAYQLDGINIDLENLDPIYKDNLVVFMKKLRTIVPIEKQISIAVAPVPTGTPQGWQRVYDYKKLADALTGPKDFLMIMAYDEHTQEGAGPVASYPFVENSIKYALNIGVPKGKIVLGIPFYGRIWGQNTLFYGSIGQWQINDVMAKLHPTKTYDTVNKTPKYVFTVKSGNPSYTINGRVLPPDTYTIWCDDSISLKAKLNLVQKYDLKGSASWSLMQEDSSTWDFYDTWLDAQYFPDVIGHWSEENIYAVNCRDWMVGKETGNFEPEVSLTRAEAAAIMVRAMGYDTLTPTTAPLPFTDISGHWAQNEIHIAQEKGLVKGKGDNLFDPDGNITREEAAQLLDRLLQYGKPALPATSPFSDLSPSQWSYEAVINMKEHNIINGYPNGTFKPEGQITRAEIAKLMKYASSRIDELCK